MSDIIGAECARNGHIKRWSREVLTSNPPWFQWYCPRCEMRGRLRATAQEVLAEVLPDPKTFATELEDEWSCTESSLGLKELIALAEDFGVLKRGRG